MALIASLSKVPLALAQRPSLVIVLLGISGFLFDYLVRPISLVGLVLLLLAASPFVLRMLKGEPKAAMSPKVEAAAPVVSAPAPAADPMPQPARARPARPPQPESAAPAPRRPEPREPHVLARPAANRVPRFDDAVRADRQRSPVE